MSEFDKLLSNLANELEALDNGHGEGPNSEQILDVLKRRLLPLLAAGQAMRDGQRVGLSCPCGSCQSYREWDKQKQAAMEGRCSTDQK